MILFEAGAEWEPVEERLAELPGPTLLLRTKCDQGPPGPLPEPQRFVDVLEVSARTRSGLEAFVERVTACLPEGPALYPEDFLTDAPLRFLAAEQIREVVFETYADEIPYAVAVEVESWKETRGELRVAANVLVERDSQKAIVVGRGGQMLKKIGVESRKKIAELCGLPVHLNLWVKTDKNWSKRPRRARQLGYL